MRCRCGTKNWYAEQQQTIDKPVKLWGLPCKKITKYLFDPRNSDSVMGIGWDFIRISWNWLAQLTDDHSESVSQRFYLYAED